MVDPTAGDPGLGNQIRRGRQAISKKKMVSGKEMKTYIP
jgi:hypothetical protein